MKMETWYDIEEDILGLRLSEGTYWKSIELENGVVIDVTKDGIILGMEVLKASKVFSDAKNVLEKANQTN